VVSLDDWLVTVFGSFCPQGRLQLGPEATHYQFGLTCCCLLQMAAVLPYYCNSIWSVPPPARWGHSVLSTTVSPTRLAQESPTFPLWDVGLSPQSHCQPLGFTMPLLTGSSAPLGGWLSTPLLLSAFVPYPAFVHSEFNSLPHSCSQRLV
jgi:hypothetical protein